MLEFQLSPWRLTTGISRRLHSTPTLRYPPAHLHRAPSPSLWSVPRSCGDYAVTVNPQLNVPQYPVPLPGDVFVQLRGGKRFTEFDLKNAYQQLPLDPNSRQFVTINTHRGLYQYRRFGIASSPAIFQRTMDIILQGLEHVAAIQDDILITARMMNSISRI